MRATGRPQWLSPRINRPPTWSILRPLKAGRYLFEIDDVMLDDEYGATKLRLTITAGEYGGRHVTAHLFPGNAHEFLRAVGLDELRPDKIRGKLVRASIRKKHKKSGGVVPIIVDWEAADFPPGATLSQGVRRDAIGWS